MSTITQGQAGEDLACRYLEQQGLTLVARNYRCRLGELDLIMREREQLVFVEVRSRAHSRYGSAAETVTARKRERLRRAAAHYLQRQRYDLPCRFDVVAIDRSSSQPALTWIKDAFQAG
jgi:putative endonuclease